MGAYSDWLEKIELQQKLQREFEMKKRLEEEARARQNNSFASVVSQLQNNDAKLATALGKHQEEVKECLDGLYDKHDYVMNRVCALEAAVGRLEGEMLERRATRTKKRLRVTVCAGGQRLEIERQF